MKVLGINCSPRKDGNTALLYCMQPMQDRGGRNLPTGE